MSHRARTYPASPPFLFVPCSSKPQPAGSKHRRPVLSQAPLPCRGKPPRSHACESDHPTPRLCECLPTCVLVIPSSSTSPAAPRSLGRIASHRAPGGETASAPGSGFSSPPTRPSFLCLAPAVRSTCAGDHDMGASRDGGAGGDLSSSVAPRPGYYPSTSKPSGRPDGDDNQVTSVSPLRLGSQEETERPFVCLLRQRC